MLRYFLQDNDKILIEDAIKNGLLKNNFPVPYLCMCAEQREWTGTPSTTQLINGTRMEYLKIFTPYAEDPGKMAFRLLGTKVHADLEHMAPKECITEIKIKSDKLTGIMDLLEPQKDKSYCLIDYKTWGSVQVKRALGLEKKTSPLFDDEGKPIFYKRSGKGYEAGTQKNDIFYEPNSALSDMWETELQLNRYRLLLEVVNEMKISSMKVFVIVRDGGTWYAKQNGVLKKTYYIDVKKLDDKIILEYFEKKYHALLDCLHSYIAQHQHVCGYSEISDIDLILDFDLLVSNSPGKCSDRETWNGIRCERFCSVKEYCEKIEEAKNAKN